MKSIARLGAAFALLAATSLTAISPAFAHAEFVAADPAADAKVAAPQALEISFSEPVEVSFSKVVVKGSDGKEVGTGLVVLNPGDDKKLHVPLNAAPPAGPVTVEWTVVSTDGHKTNGSYTFTVTN